jgi:dTDP-4-amino-4,6-dideoxygalactose transaminase
MQIPFVDLKSQYLSIKQEIDDAISSVIRETAFIGGRRIVEFEETFAAAQGAKHCIAVANGTDALYVVMKMLDIGRGHEVITVANSWISTSETISQTGAKPVFVDIDRHSNIDVSLIEDAITENTKAIIPVHLYGQPADIDTLRTICKNFQLALIEDCAQAHLAEFDGTPVGNFGSAGTFSFYPGKNLGAYGDAGAIIANDAELAERCRMFARHGAHRKHEHQIEGINSRMDGIQAAILNVKLKYLADWTRRRQKVANMYSEQLSGVDSITRPITAPNRSHVYHLYVIRSPKRDKLREHLTSKGVQTGIHYPTALPFLPAYAYLNCDPSGYNRARKYQGEILSLPIFPEMTEEKITYVTSAIKEFCIS